MNENTTPASSNNNSKLLLLGFWILSIVVTGFLAYGYGKANIQTAQKSDEKVLNAQTNEISNLKDPMPTSESTTVAAQSTTLPADASTTSTTATNTSTCTKTGFAQKWEYLTAYTVKANDTLESIATEQLKDASRVNELLKLNGVGPYVVGSTLYLPPATITKSSGNIRQLYGKLIERNATSWHISFTADKKGQGLLIPAFLFDSVANKDSFQIGDCVTVLLDDGYKVYSLTNQ